jgi:hypothetical protein
VRVTPNPRPRPGSLGPDFHRLDRTSFAWSDMVQGRSRAGASNSRARSKVEVSTRGFWAGVALVGGAVLSLGYQGTMFAMEHYPKVPMIAEAVNTLKSPGAKHEQGANVLAKDTNLVFYYPQEKDPEQRWMIHLPKPTLLREGVEVEGTYSTGEGALAAPGFARPRPTS